MINEIFATGHYDHIELDMMAGATVSGQALITAMNILSQIVDWSHNY